MFIIQQLDLVSTCYRMKLGVPKLKLLSTSVRGYLVDLCSAISAERLATTVNA